MSDRFYRAFEERYYAPREVIKALRRQYLPFAKLIADLYPGAPTFDAGCGRGEWLELMNELELSPFGVDLDEGMLSACVELGLPAQRGDAIAYLATLPNDSQVIVSAFHVVEHITFDHLRTLVAEALRVLKPGGLLIMETPNPENIVVATRNFYLDPTHQRPIPSMLLSFVAEYAGFARVKTLRLQESKELVNKDDVSLHDVFAGASPDYAVVAQKHASDDVLALTSDVFSVDYGLSLDNLLSRWDGRFERLETKAQQAETKAQHAETTAHAAEARAFQAETTAHAAEARAFQAETIAHAAETKALHAETTAHAAETEALHAETEALHAETTAHAAEARAFQAETIAHAAEARAFQAETRDLQAQERAAKAEAQAQNLHHSLHAICNSRSWLLTAPLRWGNLQVRLLREQGFLGRTKALAKKIARPLMRNGIALVESRPALRRRCIDLARKFGFYEAIRARYQRQTDHSLSFSATSSSTQVSAPEVDTDHTQLSPRAHQIYIDLKAAIENKNKGGA